MRLYARKKSNGTRVWWASWTQDGVTVKRSTRCSTKPAAELVIARWERERADPVYARANAATFGDEARMFLSECTKAVERGRLAAPTLSMYRQKAGTLIRLIGSTTRLADIDASTFPAFMAARQAEDITASTIYKEWVTFRQILKQGWREQRFGRDPASLKPQHFGPEYKPRTTHLTWEQVMGLIAKLPRERRNPVRFALMTGARRKEVFAAQAGDIDAKKCMVRIRGTKTDASAATIPIPKPMYWLMAGSSGPPFAPWPNARRDLALACTKAGIPVVTWNDLRRTFASLLIQAGVAPHIVARLMRHKTTTMVDMVYGKTSHEDLAKLLDAQLGKRRKK